MNYFRIYDDLDTLQKEYNIGQALQDKLGDDWKVEFYSLHYDQRKIVRLYPDSEETDGVSATNPKEDKVFIFWNLFWNTYDNLNFGLADKYVKLKEAGLPLRIYAYSAYGSLKEMNSRNKVFVDRFGGNTVYKKPTSIMHDEYFVEMFAEEVAKNIGKIRWEEIE